MSEGYPGKGNKTCSYAKNPGKQYTGVYESTYDLPHMKCDFALNDCRI